MEEILGKFEDEDKNLIKFTELEDGKWIPLIYWEDLKERNKVAQQEDYKFEMPFFLDFENKDQVRQQME